MSREEAMEIIKLYQNWNTAQLGINSEEEELLVHRRALLKMAMKRLMEED